MSRKIKFHAFHVLCRLFAYLADQSGGWHVFVRPKLFLGSLIVGLGLTACGTKTVNKFENKSGFKSTDSIKTVDVIQDSTVLNAKKPLLSTTLCYFQTPTIRAEYKDSLETLEDSVKKTNSRNITLSELQNENMIDNAVPLDHIYEVADQMPQFIGGDSAMFQFISKNLTPQPIAQCYNGIQGRVICRFVVEKDGSLSNITIVRSLDPACDKEAVRILKEMPKWIPGRQNGKKTRVYYTLPVAFKLE